MPRPLRIQYAGAVYHVTNRGDRGEAIFRDDRDREHFLATLGEACGKTGWLVHAYCLLPNHFHLVVETPQANLVAGMKWLLGTYTTRFNRRHQLSGHLFSGRYKALVVDAKSPDCLRPVCEHVHLNPSRARLIEAGQSLPSYPWSSYPGYVAPALRPSWLRVDRLLAAMGISADNASGRREFERQMEARRRAETPSDWKQLRHNWCFGDRSFRIELLNRAAKSGGPSPPGAARRELAEDKAEQLLQEELRRRGWRESTLIERRKGDPEKLEIARRLRKETTVTLRWIAERLRTGTWGNLANCLYRREPAPTTKPASAPRRGRTGRKTEASSGAREADLSSPLPSFSDEPLPTHCL